MEGLDCFGGFADSIEPMRDVMIDHNFAPHHFFCQHWDCIPGLPATEGCAAAATTCDELKWPCRDLLTSGRNTNEAALAPAPMSSFKGRAHHHHIACAVECVVEAES